MLWKINYKCHHTNFTRTWRFGKHILLSGDVFPALQRDVHGLKQEHKRTGSTDKRIKGGLDVGGSGGTSTDVRPRRQHRSRIPDKPNYSLNLWSIMKNCIGKELSKIPMPVSACCVSWSLFMLILMNLYFVRFWNPTTYCCCVSKLNRR